MEPLSAAARAFSLALPPLIVAVFVRTQIGEGPVAHVGASGIAGVFSAVTSTPADVVKTRFMNDAGSR